MVKSTPPMGWNSWNSFGPNINEGLILAIADRMVDDGYLDAGYEYVVIDDCWSMRERDANGRLVPDPAKFPHGMKYVADYIHSKGLKFGMYSCAGMLTCAGYPGSMDHEFIDAATFAEWEVDLLKYDYCFKSKIIHGEYLYRRMGLALENCGRDILLSCCTWGVDQTHEWVKTTASSMWRSTTDIFDNWDSIKNLIKVQEAVHPYNGVGCFNDMDMLIVGMNGKGNVAITGCTTEEYRTHFSLWALLNSPLMIGCDIRNMTDETKSILLNKDVIAINQDELGSQPFFANNYKYEVNNNRTERDPFYKQYPLDTPIIAKYLDGGDIAIGFFNFMDSDASEWHFTLTPDNLGIPLSSGKTVELYDLWTGETVKSINGTIRLYKVAPHSCRLFRAKVVDA